MNSIADCERSGVGGEGLLASLKKVFGFSGFRPHQQVLVEGLMAGSDVFGVMPTGGGKSLCYQLPALVLDGTAVVVSPLIALMKDQVDGALAHGIRAAYLNSSLSPDEVGRVERDYRAGDLDLLYVAPERLATPGFVELLRGNARKGPSFFAIDEAHCISEWGHDFRPDYLFLSRLKELFPAVAVGAFTATATARVSDDIEARLGIERPVKIRASFDRGNLFYEVRSKRDWEVQLVEFIREHPGQSGIVYRTSRKSVEATAAMLKANGVNAAAYHAGMEAPDRSGTQDAFMRDDVTVIVATVAFGMGVDKADVRFVVHGDLPKNIESYYQETGRAGRDGDPSHCLLLYAPGDAVKVRRFIDDVSDEEERRRAAGLLQAMERFASVPQCRRVGLLEYFDETYGEESCGGCDFCAGSFQSLDVTREAQMLLSAVARTRGKFGAVHVCDIVTGADTAKIRQFGHQQLKTFGIGRDQPKAYWRSLLDALLAAGKLRLSAAQYPVPQMTEDGMALLMGQSSFAMSVDKRVEPEKVKRSRGQAPQIDCHDGLFGYLREIRKEVADVEGVPPYVVFSDRTLREIAAYMPASEAEFLRLHGIGDNKHARYGARFIGEVANFLADHPGVREQRQDWAGPAMASKASTVKRGMGETYRATQALIREGLGLEEIVTRRGMARSTVEGHISHLMEQGEEISVRQFVSEEAETLARALFDEHGLSALKPVFEGSQGQVSYGQARIVRAAIQREQGV